MKLKQLRENRKLSQQDLAIALKVSPSTISNWESGTRQPDIQMVKTIANYFNVSTDEVLGTTLETRVRSNNEEEHTLSIEQVNNIITKLKQIDSDYYEIIDKIIDSFTNTNKKSNH